jgi:hypothetical protein
MSIIPSALAFATKHFLTLYSSLSFRAFPFQYGKRRDVRRAAAALQAGGVINGKGVIKGNASVNASASLSHVALPTLRAATSARALILPLHQWLFFACGVAILTQAFTRFIYPCNVYTRNALAPSVVFGADMFIFHFIVEGIVFVRSASVFFLCLLVFFVLSVASGADMFIFHFRESCLYVVQRHVTLFYVAPYT